MSMHYKTTMRFIQAHSEYCVHRIRAITIDLDDTLWEIGPVIRRAEAELWAWLARHYPKITERFTPDAALALRTEVVAEYPGSSHDFRFLRKAVLGRMATLAGYTTDLVEEAFAVFDVARNQVELYPDVLPTLRTLSERFSVIAVTNGNADLEKIGIRELFDGVVTAVEAGAAKPARPIFDIAVGRAGVAPDETLHVGDHPEFDVAGAAAAGLRTAWMNRIDAPWPAHLRAPDATVRSVTELHELLGPAIGRER